ncbi:Type 1 glutamine amidotransferase-like domain-containing protein [Cupriavidus pinatubonensis]|uniref:Type 1 glutamine amidotransferase-like domain-containing protein n=1 Tax=Cupriavidus pinatubonensis TaxID=248026 RepID=UPI001CC335EC|nr:Type 1 glutamine amidotransferase-like domain-containing protein [Cupriavidus pinatubonensis]
MNRAGNAEAARRIIDSAELIVIGGGNTFRLLQCLRESGLPDAYSRTSRSGRKAPSRMRATPSSFGGSPP